MQKKTVERLIQVQPDFIKGDLQECAKKIIESYISRPMTLTYPSFAGTLMRAMLYFSSTEWYSNFMVNSMADFPGPDGKAVGPNRKDQYSTSVSTSVKITKLGTV